MSEKDFFQRLQEMFGNSAARKPDAESGDGIARANKGWQPKEARRRVEVMITGDPSRVGVIADTIDDFQKKLFAGAAAARENLELRITGFLDNCIHRSKWSKKPFKAAAQARRWHCEQGQTLFAEAFAHSSGEMLDDLVIIGDRFDDNMEEALRQVEHLKEQGVHIHCFHTGSDKESREAYERLATQTDGVFMHLENQGSIKEVMPVLMAHLNNRDSPLEIDTDDKEAKKLMKLLARDKPDELEKS